MALAYQIDEPARLVTITGEYAQPDEWRALLEQIRADPRRRPGFGFLRDLREASRPVDAGTVVGIIAVVRAMWEPLQVSKAAIVTRPGVDAPAMVAHALAQSQHLPLQAFTSYDDAVAWLAAR